MQSYLKVHLSYSQCQSEMFFLVIFLAMVIGEIKIFVSCMAAFFLVLVSLKNYLAVSVAILFFEPFAAEHSNLIFSPKIYILPCIRNNHLAA